MQSMNVYFVKNGVKKKKRKRINDAEGKTDDDDDDEVNIQKLGKHKFCMSK